MISKVNSAVILGIDAYNIEVEIDISSGSSTFNIVGLPDNAVKESRDRVRSAINNSNFEFPIRRIIVNLAPADLKKAGAGFDLPIAIGILANQGEFPPQRFEKTIIAGELSLDGKIKSIKGALSIALMARENGFESVILPKENAKEAAVVEGIKIYGAAHLIEIINFLKEVQPLKEYKRDLEKVFFQLSEYDIDFSDVKGQYQAKRAIEVAIAGGHNILLIGPPGAGKTMLAKRIPTILPELTIEEAIEITRIHSVAGIIDPKLGLVATRPFRSPHHTISDAGLIGGGQIPKPGEVSLAHNGVLFLDELPEFKKNVLEVLRQPLEDGQVTIARATISLTFPSKFVLVAAMNPCPCGYLGDPKHSCNCTVSQIVRYRNKISGPLLDRIDIQLEVPPVKYSELSDSMKSETSAQVRKRINQARNIQLERFKGKNIYFNSQIKKRDLEKYCVLDSASEELLKAAIERLGFSARGYDKVLKIARTIADLENSKEIKAHHISEAIQYRNLDRQFI